MSTSAEYYKVRFEELSETNPPDLVKHLADAERFAVKKNLIEDEPVTKRIPGRIIFDLTFHDGSTLRVTKIRRYRKDSSFRWEYAQVITE